MGDTSTFQTWLNVLYLLSRYLHLVAAMFMVGGIVFYEMVVPVAIQDLREEIQVAIFARARWVFRWIIWSGAVLLIVTGLHLTARRMNVYIASEFDWQSTDFARVPWPLKTGWWWAAHVASAVIAILIAIYMVSGDRPPEHPIGWLRLNLMILLIVVFFAVVTDQVDQIRQEHTRTQNSTYRAMPWVNPDGIPAILPATQP